MNEKTTFQSHLKFTPEMTAAAKADSIARTVKSLGRYIALKGIQVIEGEKTFDYWGEQSLAKADGVFIYYQK